MMAFSRSYIALVLVLFAIYSLQYILHTVRAHVPNAERARASHTRPARIVYLAGFMCNVRESKFGSSLRSSLFVRFRSVVRSFFLAFAVFFHSLLLSLLLLLLCFPSHPPPPQLLVVVVVVAEDPEIASRSHFELKNTTKVQF